MAIPQLLHFIWLAEQNNSASVPADVQGNIDSWRSFHPAYDAHVWSARELRDAVSEFSNLNVWACMEAARFAAMKADIARLALIYKYGGVWSDVKNAPLRPFLKELSQYDLPVLVEHAPTAALHLSNSFFCAPPKHQFFLECLTQVCENVTNRVSGGVFSVTGPGVLRRIQQRWVNRGRADDLKVFESKVVWAQGTAKNSEWMKRTSASYNGKNHEEHWSVREKINGIYV